MSALFSDELSSSVLSKDSMTACNSSESVSCWMALPSLLITGTISVALNAGWPCIFCSIILSKTNTRMTTWLQCSPRHRRRQQTSSSACWMPLQGSSAIPGNTTKDWHNWSTRIYTGLTFLSESVTNFVYWHIDVSLGYRTPVSQVAARQHLRSAARHRLVVPRHRLSTYGRRAFTVAGPMTFNALPDELRDPTVNTTTFRRL